MPTLCSLAGYQPPQHLKWDGVNIAALLIDRTELPERPLYEVAPGWRARSLRLGDWKLIVRGEGDSRKFELFDLARDSAEANNQAEQQPGRVKQLLSVLEKVAARDRDAVAE
jgi:arylsulfatase A-like enzyme